jgi:hypothetical protein
MAKVVLPIEGRCNNNQITSLHTRGFIVELKKPVVKPVILPSI